MNPSSGNTDNPSFNSGSCLHGGLVGIFMGLADSVPGISGGTVALVMGIYRRWIKAIGLF